MDGFDILVSELKMFTGWGDHFQVRALMFNASGQLHTLHEGKKHRYGVFFDGFSNALEEYVGLTSSLLADGWEQVPEQEAYDPRRNYRQNIFYRQSTVLDSRTLTNPALMTALNKLIQDQAVDSDMAKGLLDGLSITASFNKELDERERLLSMLISLTELHRNGDLDDEEFAAAKKALLDQ